MLLFTTFTKTNTVDNSIFMLLNILICIFTSLSYFPLMLYIPRINLGDCLSVILVAAEIVVITTWILLS